jgi:hypothetical protein
MYFRTELLVMGLCIELFEELSDPFSRVLHSCQQVATHKFLQIFNTLAAVCPLSVPVLLDVT